MVAERVQRLAADGCQFPGPQARRTLIHERTGLLAGPGGRVVAHPALAHLDPLRHRAVRHLNLLRQPFPPPYRGVVAEQHAFGTRRLTDGVDDLAPHRLESRAEQLQYHPTVVPVRNERRQPVTFAVHQPVRSGVHLSSPGNRGADPFLPPCVIHFPLGALQQPEPDLGRGRMQRLPEEASSLINHANQPGPVRRAHHVAAKNPRVSPVPAGRTAGRDGGRVGRVRVD